MFINIQNHGLVDAHDISFVWKITAPVKSNDIDINGIRQSKGIDLVLPCLKIGYKDKEETTILDFNTKDERDIAFVNLSNSLMQKV